jgi:pyruvate,water dikinase
MEWVRSLFAKFQRIQKYNTKALEVMAEMDRALGGEYIFDRAFLQSSVRELSRLAHQVVYSLNAMSRNRYVDLFDRYQSIRDVLDDILAGGLGPLGSSLALPYSMLGVEMEPLAGVLNVCLAEARNRLDIAAPDGFAVTVTGCRRLAEATEADFPPELAEAIETQVKDLFERRGGPIALSVRACSSDMNFDVLTGVASEEILAACRLAVAKYSQAAPESKKGPLSLAVHETVRGHVAGSVSVLVTNEFPSGLFCVTASSLDGPGPAESYFLRRTYPFAPVESKINTKPLDRPLHGSSTPLPPAGEGLCSGPALLSASFLRNIAQCATAFERILGYPQDLGWVREEEGDRPVIVNVSPARGLNDATGIASGAEDSIESADVLLSGGETAQMGIAAGPVVHISEDDPERCPNGAVAVAGQASPKLSAILRKASAVVTEIGTSTGHLATIARELRIPAIFGAPGAMERLPEGIEVTVDAGEKTVYRGIVEHLLASRAWSAELYPTDPEYVTLRRLLRWIIPLSLIDPDSEGFCVRNCRSYHDIIHFAHERSIEELLKIQDKAGLKDQSARKLEIDVPIDLFVLDIGGGVSPGARTRIRMDDIISKPFAAFLRGLTRKDVWDREPGALGLRDIMSGLDRTFTALTDQPEYSGRNHAILAENYMNIGFRLGYHYSVIDSYLSGNVNQNYIYFRFAGGFADEDRRLRRAKLIRVILEQLRFKVTVKGDLVVGMLKIAGSPEVMSALRSLGELTGFTRQIDIAMDSEGKVEQLARLFREKSGGTPQEEKTLA